MIDRLEALASSGRKVPVARRSLIDADQLLQLVDQLRLAVPKDLQEAREMLQKREQIINQALAEAKRIKATAGSESRAMLEQHELINVAKSRAEQIVEESQSRVQRVLDQANAEAKSCRAGADGYAQEVLYKLEQEVSNVLTTVRRGIEVLDIERATPVAEH